MSSRGKPGTIVELDPIDALGWIELDEGGRVRFGGTACKGFRGEAPIGMRVEVMGTAPGFRGVLKAVEVRPLDPPPPAVKAAREVTRVAWSDFVAAHPRWSDITDVSIPCARPAKRPDLPRHPLFDAWRAEIVTTAPTVIDLHVPDFRSRDPIEPTPADSFALGRVAFLDEPRWPACGKCGKPLRMCLQVAPAVMADFVPGGRGLVALICFPCAYGNKGDPRIGHVRLVEPRHRLVGPEAWESDADRQLEGASQRVTAGEPWACVPGSMWLQHRSERIEGLAGGELCAFDDVTKRMTGPLPPGVELKQMGDPGSALDAWLGRHTAGKPWEAGRLGGAPAWDQYDATPSCAHGEMRHLCDYDGGQFLDGALHVFACSAWTCDLAFYAEF